MHPERGLLDASKFVPLAEEAGLVFRLDDRIVASAVETRAGLTAAGVDPRFRIWCNVSSGQLTREHVRPRGLPRSSRPRVATRVRSGSRSPRPRSFPTLRPRHARSRRCGELGIKVALDDFGTGHSSLTLLRSLPIDRVKIDQTFVRELDVRRERRRDRAQRDHARQRPRARSGGGGRRDAPSRRACLANLGCRYAQGYLWAKALPLDDLTAELRGQASGAAHTANSGSPKWNSGDRRWMTGSPQPPDSRK